MTSPATPPENEGHAAPPHKAAPSFYRKNLVAIWGFSLVGLIVLGGGLVYTANQKLFREPYTGNTFTVKKELLKVTIVERGNLESAENSDIICRAKAKSLGGTIASTIKWVVDDGTPVKAGELICELDDSGFQEQLKTQKNSANDAFTKWAEAKTNYVVQDSQNLSDIKTAEVNLILKQLDLKKYAGQIAGTKMMRIETIEEIRAYLANGFEEDVTKESTTAGGKFTSAYLQAVNGYEGNIETARSDKDSWLDRARWSNRMVKKGFYSLSQADSDQSRLDSMEIALRKAQGDLDIYRIFDREGLVTTAWSAVKEAERALKRVNVQAISKMEKCVADQKARKAIFNQEDEKLTDLFKEQKFYRIKAPQDGLVVYYIPDNVRGGSGSNTATVAQGEPVREGQKLIRIPNLSKMLVNVRVHEAMVKKVEGESSKPTGYGERLRSAFSFGRNDLVALASYQLAFDEVRARDDFKAKDQIVLFPGQKATIRIDSDPGRIYHGHVKSKASVPSQADFFSADVKLYATMVSIDDLDNESFKPGMSAEVTITAKESDEPVLVIPIQAVLGNVAMGSERKCFVLDANGYPQERDIVVGISNDRMVEIKSGLQEGDKVVLNPRPLLPEKSDLKPGTPSGKRDGGEDGKKFKGGPGMPTGKGPDGAVNRSPDGQAPPAGQEKKFKK